MKLEYFILGILKLKPRTGYDLKKFLDTEGRFARPRTPLSQIYNTLKRMTMDGWLTYQTESQEGKPDRKIYSLTPVGESEFNSWLTSPHVPGFRFQDRDLFGKLMFSCFVENDIVLTYLETELAYRKDQIKKFRPRDRTLQISTDCDIDANRAQRIADQLHEYGAEAVDHYLDWLERTIQFFEREMEA